MLKIAVCDDDRQTVTEIKELVEKYQAQRASHIEMLIRTFGNGACLVDAIKRNELFEIILLDVVMPFLNGIETAREIRLYDKTVKIIFLTSNPQFALDSYDVRAFSYLLKDRVGERLPHVLNEAITEIVDFSGKYIMLKTKTGLVKLYFHSIEYVEVTGRTITVYLGNGDAYETMGTLTEIEEIFLAHPRFIKPHRSYIVNMDHIRRLDRNELVTLNSHRIPVPKALHTEVKKLYMDYSFQRGAGHD